MPKHDKSHFGQYTPQNQAKHKILSAYLPAYLIALKNLVDRFHYIDGFAGRGKYEGDIEGSALLALKTMEKAGVLDRCTISLVENDPAFYAELKENIEASPLAAQLFEPPMILEGQFSGFLDTILTRPIYSRARVATFAFVDPCGVDGVYMSDITRILEMKCGEVLLFFNYDAVNRLLGGVVKGTHDKSILQRIFNSPSALDKLIDVYAKAADSQEREGWIWRCFIYCLKKSSKARYFVPFQFEAKQKARTSHYLVHISSDKLAFRLMKEVMWDTGIDNTDEFGKLKFLNDNERGKQFSLFNPDKEKKKNEILKDIEGAKRPVSYFTMDCVEDPNDTFSGKAYKAMLLELEADEKVVVYDKNNKEPTPANKRRKYNAKPTLGDEHWLRIHES